MQLSPHLLFDGQCEAAFNFYATCLDAKIEFMAPYEGTPAESMVPPDWRKRVIHATLRIGDTVLMGADCPPDRYSKPQGFSVALQLNEPSRAERIFKALAEKGSVKMPIQETFWAAKFGMLVDQFGIPWEINCAKPA